MLLRYTQTRPCLQGCHAISGKKGAQSLVPSCQAFVKSLAEAIPSPQSHSGSTTDGTPTGQQVATADRGTNTVASGSNQKLVAKKPGAARLSDLHTLSPAQSEAALQRLRLSDETASSTAQHAPESRSVSDAKQSAPHKPAAASQGSTADAAQGGDIASSHALAPSDIQATSASHLVNTAQLSFFPGTHAPSEAAASDPAPGRLAVAGQMVSQASSMASTASTEPPQVKSPFSPITAADLAYAAQQQLQQRVGRVVIQSLGGLGWGLESYDQDTERQLFSAVLQIKALTRSSRCAAMLSFPAGMSTLLATTTVC